MDSQHELERVYKREKKTDYGFYVKSRHFSAAECEQVLEDGFIKQPEGWGADQYVLASAMLYLGTSLDQTVSCWQELDGQRFLLVGFRYGDDCVVASHLPNSISVSFRTDDLVAVFFED